MVQRSCISFFSNDSLLLYQAKRKDCNEVLEILKKYEQASGQLVNIDKSGIMFSANTSIEDKNITSILSINRLLEHDYYLYWLAGARVKNFYSLEKGS